MSDTPITGTQKHLLRCFAAYLRKQGIESITLADSELTNDCDILIVYKSLVDGTVTVTVKNLLNDIDFIRQAQQLFEAENQQEREEHYDRHRHERD